MDLKRQKPGGLALVTPDHIRTVKVPNIQGRRYLMLRNTALYNCSGEIKW